MSKHVERRLAAILAADVAGSCRLIGIDEEGTLAQLKALRKTLFDPKITDHRGRIVKNTGDGALVEFASVVDAVRCADEIQRGMAEQNTDVPQDKRIEFRIGIHVGDIIIEENDIFGDGVNIAVRLEGVAEPGGVSISDDAHRQIRGKIDIDYDDMGPQEFKNIAEPIRVWRVRIGPSSSRAMLTKPPTEPAEPLALPNKPSIAVLPFQNMSGDPEQEYFADGMVEDVITELSRFNELFVIARNSSFTYKNKAVDIRQVGQDLGVRYVLEGSVRKAANRVRITGQLVDALTGIHIWAEKYEGKLEDIFDLQDEMTTSVVGAIAPQIELAEIERAINKPTENLNAYQIYLRGMAGWHEWTQAAHNAALELFYRAIECDPSFATPYAMAIACYIMRKSNGWMLDRTSEIAETERLSRRAAELGRNRNNALALCWSAHGLLMAAGDWESGLALVDRALVLNPNLAVSWQRSGWIRIASGQCDLAIEHFTRAMRLNPLDPLMHLAQSGMSSAYFFQGSYDESAVWAERALHLQPNWSVALRYAAASNALIGRQQVAQQAVDRLRQVTPEARLSNIHDYLTTKRPEHIARFTMGMRSAGFPE